MIGAGFASSLVVAGLLMGAPAAAQHAGHPPATGQGSDAAAASEPAASTPPTSDTQMPAGMEHPMGSMESMGPMQGGRPPPEARDPDYSMGLERSRTGTMEMADDEPYGYVLFEKFEGVDTNAGGAQRLDARGSYGGDLNRAFLKVDAEAAEGRLEDTRIEALWNRYVATFWSTQLGLRQDAGGDGRRRTWAAFGIEGLAPYWFDIEATGYLTDGGRIAARFEVSYQARLTQRLVLTPTVEAEASGFSDARRGVGAGLSTVETGLRLRYEFTRQFAPYVGLSWVRRFGRTADFARAAGASAGDSQVLAGVRVWF